MEVYSIENLTFSYPANENNVLKNITFSVQSGEFITICGLSGSGKSTLLRQLKTCMQPVGKRSGNIFFESKLIDNIDFETQSKKIGFVMQSPENQCVTDKVWHELAFGLENLSLNTPIIKKRIAETASFFGIEKWLDKTTDKLSGGQKQILNLASVVIMQPSVLILDEPTSQLDPISSSEFISVLRKINTELGTTIILSEHNLNDVFSISNRIIVMSDGEIISDNTPQKTGQILYLKNSNMFSALPSPTKIFTVVEGDKEMAPLTVSDGRKWLENYTKNIKLKPIEEKKQIIRNEIPVLELKDIWFRYERGLPDILKGTNLKLYKGEFLAILGGNGAGKSTMLSVISGISKQYRGNIYFNGKNISKIDGLFENNLAILPQNPQTLFIKNTVEEDLYDIFSEKKIPKEIQKQKVDAAISLLKLEKFKNRHPYDISGGEQQKAALAKVLLTNPKALLLDEPTKCLDSAYKKVLAQVIKALILSGITVIMISHDIEFCAEYADRCAMFFNGEIVFENTPELFFSDNNFYTTSSSRMSKGIIKNAVTEKDILYSLNRKPEKDKNDYIKSLEKIKDIYNPIIICKKTEKSKLQNKTIKPLDILKIVLISISLIIFVFSISAIMKLYDLPQIFANLDFLPYITVILSLIILILSTKKESNINIKSIPKKTKLSKRTISAILMIFLAIPLTLFTGIYFFDNRKYLFISLLIMFECMLPFFVMFEKRKVQAREIVLIATLCALAISGRVIFYMFPQFKPVSALVIISGAALGGETGFLIGAVTMLVSNIFFGQGALTPWQMFTMGIIGLLAGIIYQKGILPRNKISLSIFGFISVIIIYGGIMNPASLIISQSAINISTLTAFYISGLPMDIIHGLSTAVFLFIGAEPILNKLERIKIKYGLIEQN